MGATWRSPRDCRRRWPPLGRGARRVDPRRRPERLGRAAARLLFVHHRRGDQHGRAGRHSRLCRGAAALRAARVQLPRGPVPALAGQAVWLVLPAVRVQQRRVGRQPAGARRRPPASLRAGRCRAVTRRRAAAGTRVCERRSGALASKPRIAARAERQVCAGELESCDAIFSSPAQSQRPDCDAGLVSPPMAGMRQLQLRSRADRRFGSMRMPMSVTGSGARWLLSGQEQTLRPAPQNGHSVTDLLGDARRVQ